jgi:hypothetical protein
MSISRFSFNETPDYLNAIGFQVRLSLRFSALSETITIQKGSLIYGFKNAENETYGYLLNNDIKLIIPGIDGIYYITMDINGNFDIPLGDFNNIKGIGANIPNIPWYTFNNEALVGKVFKSNTINTGYIVCDDPFWCEFEGVF